MNRRLALLAIVAASLGAYVALDGRKPENGVPAGQSTLQPSASPQGTSAGRSLNPLEGLDASSYTAIAERPLFNPGRAARPPEVVAAPVVEEPPPEPVPVEEGPRAEDFVLLGIAAGPTGRVAAIRLAASGEVSYLREGQPIGSWSVLAVDDTSVSIGTANAQVTINLFETAKGPSTVTIEQAPAPAAPAAQPDPESAD